MNLSFPKEAGIAMNAPITTSKVEKIVKDAKRKEQQNN
jgi:hypothetical protein